MRTALLAINGLVVVVFTIGFVLTFLGRPKIEDASQEFVEEKTRTYARPVVAVAEEVLEIAPVQKFLGEEKLVAARAEIAEFRESPAKFVAGLVGTAKLEKPPAFLNKYAEKLYGWKVKVRDYFEKVLAKLFLDLRIFTLSNVAGGLVGVFLAWKSRPGRRKALVTASGVMLIALLYSTWGYIDSFSFFTILFDSYLGLWYPVGLLLTFGGILYVRNKQESAAKEAATA